MKVEKIDDFADVVINLYKGIVSINDGKIWHALIDNEKDIQDYLERVGLHLHINYNDGYAYLEQPEKDDDGFDIKVARLTRRIALSPIQTIVLIVLRQKLLDFDSTVHEEDICIITREEILMECTPFFQDTVDEKKTYRSLDNAINKIRDYGFIKRLQARNNDVFIVQKVLKSKLNSQQLSDLKSKLQAHYTEMNANNDED